MRKSDKPASARSRREFLAQAAAAGAAGSLLACATVNAKDTVSETPTAPAANAPAEVATGPGIPFPAPAAPPSPASVPARRTIGPNDHIRCGFIGVGNRGSALLQAALARPDVDVVAVADAYDVWRDRALQWCRKEQRDAKGYVRFEEMLEESELDAVVIATPDHAHAPAALFALDRGLDVYCEKPMTLTWQDAAVLRDRAQQTGAVLQVGTQLRSMDLYQKARDLVQGGAIGKLVMVHVNRTFNGGNVTNRQPPPEANPTTVHWDVFLRDTTQYPFDLRRYFRWRDFVEYSNGLIGDLMLHHLDACHFVTGCGMPERVVSVGGIYRFDDGRTCPDTVSALVEYPDKFQFNFATTGVNDHYGLVERYLGSEGTLEIRDMSEMSVFKQDLPEEIVESSGPEDAPHMADFIEAIRSRGKTVAPVEAGFLGATVCHMAVASQRSGQAVGWADDRPVFL
jgi:predicted dehydrogenase